LVQVTQNQEKAIEVLSKLGHLPSKVSDSELEYVQGRLDFASTWVKEFAPDEFKFDVQSEISDGVRTELSSGQISGLKALVKVLETKEYTDNELYEEFYGICKEAEINPKEFFQGAYRVLLNRDRGPKLAGFILTIGKEKVVELLKQL
jgi:lysyl-tRNA synthetase class 1